MTKAIFLQEIEELDLKLNIDRMINAVNFAERAHKGQVRKSGEEYFIHPLHVALILARLGMDEDTIISGLLHDVIEDTSYTYEDIKELFGEQVANIVDGVTKIERIKYESKEYQQAENFRKMLLAMSKDIRVILVKLADRLHNMRTLEFKNAEKRIQTSNETLEIYVPIAHRLGIFKLKWELEDLSFKYKEPKEYKKIVNLVAQKRKQREQDIDKKIEEISALLEENHIQHRIYGRPKNYFSIYKKMQNKNKAFEEIHDITAIRVIVEKLAECYSVLGLIHSKFKPIPGRFKDYIAMPKSNMYQSLHTTLIGEGASTFEVQIRTEEMHRIAEYGIAAHWRYKEQMQGNLKGLSWLDELMKWEEEVKNPTEFINSVKMDLFINHVYVFTPGGDVLELPDGSTPVDFAYKIHTAVGNSCIGAKVNGRIVPLNYQLNIGDIVEILTSKASTGPSRDWLKFVKSSHAKNKIKNFFRKESRQENIEKGKDQLERTLRRYDTSIKSLLTDDVQKKLLDRFNVQNVEGLYASIGYGGVTPKQVINLFKEEKLIVEQETEKEIIKTTTHHESNQGIRVDGLDDVLIRFAKCCKPIPGDKIIGFITRGKGITIHRSDCTNFKDSDRDRNRFIDVEWDDKKNVSHHASIQIIAKDRPNLLSDITSLMQNTNHTLRGVNAKINNNLIATTTVSFDVENKEDLKQMQQKLRNIKGVMEVYRI